MHLRDESPQGLPNSGRPPNACIDDLISSLSPFLNPVFTDFFQLLIVKALCISLVSSHTRPLSSLSHKYHQNNEQNCRFQQKMPVVVLLSLDLAAARVRVASCLHE